LEFSQFWDVWDKVKSKYVKQPIKDEDMFYGAIQGMVMSLGDPYSLYFPPKAAEDFAKDLSGELEGIGAEIGVKNNQLVVVAPLPDTPAEKAGLKPGDKILYIDKESTFGMDVSTAVSKIRGKADTKVVLTITRDGLTKAAEITITRLKINVPSILFSVKPNNVAYLRVMQFNDDTTSQLNRYIKQIQARGSRGIVLDLRNNPGGYLSAAIEMASQWVTSGVVVSEKGIDGQSNEHETQGPHLLSGIKTVVLINKGSASASEIVAGALQDSKKAILIGEQTFGKGSVQDFETFPDGSALKLTVAEWFTPNGRNINKDGIKPDIEIKEDWQNEKIGEDVVLSKALELITASSTAR
jgi:carboxyl-terminal processing protease